MEKNTLSEIVDLLIKKTESSSLKWSKKDKSVCFEVLIDDMEVKVSHYYSPILEDKGAVLSIFDKSEIVEELEFYRQRDSEEYKLLSQLYFLIETTIKKRNDSIETLIQKLREL